jgi:hypothetical protein
VAWIEGETQEQRRERVDKILEKNTKPMQQCAGCHKDINPDTHTVVETIKGPFHGFPMRCVYRINKEN